MLKTMLTYAENVIVIVAVGVSVHYLGGLDWPWAIVIGAAVSVALPLAPCSVESRARGSHP